MKKKLVLPRLSPRQTIRLCIMGVIVLLVVLLCISNGMRSHIQNQYSSARTNIGEEIYDNLYMLCQTFDQVSIPGQDVQYSIIPTMKNYYLAACTLDSAMYSAFGQRYSVLSSGYTTSLDNAFAAYDTAFQSGLDTEAAKQQMSNCMDMVRELLSTRFREGRIKAQ